MVILSETVVKAFKRMKENITVSSTRECDRVNVTCEAERYLNPLNATKSPVGLLILLQLFVVASVR